MKGKQKNKIMYIFIHDEFISPFICRCLCNSLFIQMPHCFKKSASLQSRDPHYSILSSWWDAHQLGYNLNAPHMKGQIKYAFHSHNGETTFVYAENFSQWG